MEGMGGTATSGDGGGVQGDGEGQGVADGVGQAGLPDVAALVQMLEQQGQGQEELRQFLLQLPTGDHALPDGAEFDGDDRFDAEGLQDSGFDPGDSFDIDPHAQANELTQALGGLVGQAVAPIQQQVAQHLHDAQREGQVRDLLGEFPELRDVQTMRDTLDAATTIVHAAGLPPDVAVHPHIVRMTYLAGLAKQQARAEAEAVANPPEAAHLEGGGGAGPGGAQVSMGQRIANATDGAGSSVLPFR